MLSYVISCQLFPCIPLITSLSLLIHLHRIMHTSPHPSLPRHPHMTPTRPMSLPFCFFLSLYPIPFSSVTSFEPLSPNPPYPYPSLPSLYLTPAYPLLILLNPSLTPLHPYFPLLTLILPLSYPPSPVTSSWTPLLPLLSPLLPPHPLYE